ncbi:MAG: efflux RND transporter periplasmic adaptor subunit [Gemmataceae bacterium]
MPLTPVAGPTPRRWPVRILLGALARVPAAVTLAGLIGLLAWGHATEWTLPKFAALTGEVEPPAEKWCEAHNVPDAVCVECHPDLLPKPTYYGWCREAGVHECPQCHPDVAQLPTPPAVTPADKQRTADALAFAPRPENVSKSTLHHRRIQFASAEAADRAGIAVEPVGRGPVAETAAGPGEVTFDPTRTARLSPRLPGTVARVFKELGDRVATGEVVALIDAPEVGRAKTDLLLAVNLARLKAATLKTLTAGGVAPDRSVREAEAQLAEARIRVTAAEQALANLGLRVAAADLADVPDDKLADRVRTLGLPLSTGGPGSGSLWPLTAPVPGVVVAREVVVGEAVDPARVLFVVSDPARVWVTLGLRAEDARGVKAGQKLTFRPDGDRRELAATVDYIAPAADHKTRTVKVRAAVPDAPAWLKANTFGTGTVVLREAPDAVVVPADAVQPVPDGQVVFVRDKDYLTSPYKLFDPRFVRTGAGDGKHTEIIAGLAPGEVVVVQGAAALRAELLRGSLGEG